jgi:hypothetical protein
MKFDDTRWLATTHRRFPCSSSQVEDQIVGSGRPSATRKTDMPHEVNCRSTHGAESDEVSPGAPTRASTYFVGDTAVCRCPMNPFGSKLNEFRQLGVSSLDTDTSFPKSA